MRPNALPTRRVSLSVEHRLALLFLALNCVLRLWHPAFIPHDFLRGLGAGFGIASAICYILELIRIRRNHAAAQDANTGS